MLTLAPGCDSHGSGRYACPAAESRGGSVIPAAGRAPAEARGRRLRLSLLAGAFFVVRTRSDMPKTEKVEKVRELTERIEGSQALFLTDFRGLTVLDATDLRRSL